MAQFNHVLVALTMAIVPWVAGCAQAQPAGDQAVAGTPSLTLRAVDQPMRGLIERYATDRNDLRRFYDVSFSDQRLDRLERFTKHWQDRLAAVDFDALDQDGRVDYLLLRNHLEHELSVIGRGRDRNAELGPLVPFAAELLALERSRRAMEPVDPEAAADVLAGVLDTVKALQEKVVAEGGEGGEGDDAIEVRPVLARRAAQRVDRLRRVLTSWHGSYAGFMPEFSWWVDQPYEDLDAALKAYAKRLREEIAGLHGEDDDPLVGDPIGREALLDDLVAEMIPMTPERLIEIAEREFAWCDEQMAAASREMGFGDDWRAALDRVKEDHVPPGEQPALVVRQAREAIAFLDEHDLVTIPPMCRELWRWEYLSERTQRTLPFAVYGGQYMGIAYPTDRFDHRRKLESMRGNNVHFSRIVTPHELIPGHHLQGFMADRYKAYRQIFSTPFLVEGWALHWEMLLYDLGYPRGPEDRIGMLFWRRHRCARIIVSLKFHLGQMTPQQMIDLLVDRVGLERDGATAEVRRYIGDDYSPLYQCGYMVGGLQLRSLHRDLVGSGRMTQRRFHDAVLVENSIPIELIRASLTGQALTRDWQPGWKFYEQLRGE